MLKGSDAPEFALDDPSLAIAFGNPSDAKVRTVPSGKSLILLRFQATVDGAPRIGRWAVLYKVIKSDYVREELKQAKSRISRLMVREKLSVKDITRALNILPEFTASSVFWAIQGSALPPVGTITAVRNDAFLEVLQSGEKFLEGHIQDGYSGLVQVKDVLPNENRTPCLN